MQRNRPETGAGSGASNYYTREIQKGSSGNDLLSQGPASQVPSALEDLTAWFGMEQGIAPPLKSPEEPFMPLLGLAPKN